jgi:hypothetical protein
MSLLGRIFKSSERSGSSSKSDARDIDRRVDTVEDQYAPQHSSGQFEQGGFDSDRELERWAAEDDKDVKR